MIYPDRLAEIKIAHPTPNLMKIVENVKEGSIASFFRVDGNWIIEFPLKKDVPLAVSEDIARQMTAEFNKLGMDAYSEIRNGKLYRHGSTDFDNFFNELAKINGAVIYPATFWDYKSLSIYIGIFGDYYKDFSDWMVDFVTRAPIEVKLNNFILNTENYIRRLITDHLNLNEVSIIKYTWIIPPDLAGLKEYEIFQRQWVGIPKFISNDHSEFLCVGGDLHYPKKVFTCEAGMSWNKETNYFLENRNNVLISISIASIGNDTSENEIIFYGNDSSIFKSLYNIWKLNRKEGIKYKLKEVGHLESRE